MAISRQKEEDKKERQSKRSQTIAAKYELDKRDAELLRLALDYPDAPLREFATALNISHQAVHQRMKKPAFKKALSDLLSTNDDLLKRAQAAALRRMLTLVNSSNERIALEASSRLLAAMLLPANGGLNINLPGTVVYRSRVGENGALIREAFEVPEGSVVDVTPSADPEDPPSAMTETAPSTTDLDVYAPSAEMAEDFATLAEEEEL